MAAMDYDESLAWLNSHERMGIKLGLENTTDLLAGLGDPHKSFRSVHVAGTNGKGSVCAMISSVLREEGYRVGLYTSPHLVDFRERIQVDGQMISRDDLAEVASQLRSTCQRVIKESPGREFTFFELTTVLAFLHFARQGVEEAVIEVGMGGRLDATNVIVPDCSVLSTISLEHTQYLGGTLREIAGEKAGIIKPGIPVVAIEQSPEVIAVFEGVAAEKGSPLEIVGRDLEYRLLSSTLYGTEVEIQGISGSVFVPLAGSYQAQNVALTCAALMQLMRRGLFISESAILRGLERTSWPGRMQVVSQSPMIIFDATHTPDGARVVAEEVKRLVERNLTLIIGVLDDKDLEGICRYFGPLAKTAYATAPQTKRAYPPEVVAASLRKYAKEVKIAGSISDALRSALKTSGPDEAVLVTGSLYTLGEAKRWWDEQETSQ